MMAGKRATIQDVAAQAGVSIATVSRVLTGRAFVDEEKARHVRQAMQTLQYQPSRAARAMRVNRSAILGLLISDIRNPFFTSLIRGVEDITQREGYSLLLCNTDENPRKERQYVDVLCAEGIAGAIVVPTQERSPAYRPFQERHIPFVAVDRRIRDNGVDTVTVDNVRGAYEGVAHLISNGYRRIGAITGPLTTTTGHDRLMGYREALTDAGIAYDPTLARSGSFKEPSGRLLMAELLAITPAIDAVFVANNLLTLGVLEELHARDVHIPADIAVVGFDEMPWASLSAISLTTVTQPVYELGATAAMRLVQRLRSTEPLTRQEIVLMPTLYTRASSRPRAGAADVESLNSIAADVKSLKRSATGSIRF